jgi:integrase
MPIGKLKALNVARMKTPGMYGDGGGLWLQVTSGGAKSWIFRYWVAKRDPATGKLTRNPKTKRAYGKSREMGLGSCATVSLEDARTLAQEYRRLLRAHGVDPIEARRGAQEQRAIETAKAMSFKAAAETYIKSHRKGWRNEKHAAQWSMTLLGRTPKGEETKENYCAVLHQVSIQSIDTGLIMKVLDPIWSEKSETAGRVRGRIECVLNWAAARGFRKGENPARWRGHLDHLLPARSKVRKVKHQPALPYAELPAFMAALREQGGIAARALEFTILTAARASMTTGATLDEIGAREKLWTLSAERMKSDREHRVPLTARALDLIEEMKTVRLVEDKFIFPGGKKGKTLSDAAMAAVIDRMNEENEKAGRPKWMDPRLRRPVVPHGFRSTFKDWTSECTSFPNIVSEMALAHKVSDKVEAAYRRGELLEKRRRLMEAWTAFATSDPTKAGNKVVPMRDAAGV